jgi:hypothetical protein
MLFGDDHATSIPFPDLNAHVLPDLNADANEVPLTQNAPAHVDS